MLVENNFKGEAFQLLQCLCKKQLEGGSIQTAERLVKKKDTHFQGGNILTDEMLVKKHFKGGSILTTEMLVKSNFNGEAF